MNPLRALGHRILDRLGVGADTTAQGFIARLDADGNRVSVHPRAARAAEARRVHVVLHGPDPLDTALMDTATLRALDATRARLVARPKGVHSGTSV